MAGGAAEGAAGRRLRRIGGSRAGSDQALRPAAADHAAGHCQRDQGGRGSHPAAQVDASRVHRCYTKQTFSVRSHRDFSVLSDFQGKLETKRETKTKVI